MIKSIAFHSYKGGTGKTTIAANFAALLAKKGYRVFLIDLDVYAPSLHTYFETEPIKWFNDFLNGTAEISDVLVDLTPTIINTYGNKNTVNGKLYACFCNPNKEEVYKLDYTGKQDSSRIQLVRRLILLREQIILKYDADYIIIDTSPGIRYWSMNALGIADTLFLTLKMGSLDIEGTKKMAHDIYNSFSKFGAKSYLVLNRMAGYCTPPRMMVNVTSPSSLGSFHDTSHDNSHNSSQQESYYDVGGTFSKEVGMNIISSIPCYCDIQFSTKEFLTVLNYPDHPFAKQLEALAEDKNIKIN
jgi:MinD-like ATPase involved in chromosome partitioning or flagellar assembly